MSDRPAAPSPCSLQKRRDLERDGKWGMGGVPGRKKVRSVPSPLRCLISDSMEDEINPLSASLRDNFCQVEAEKLFLEQS